LLTGSLAAEAAVDFFYGGRGEDGIATADMLRDSPLRLLGYANEVGEGFRPLLPRFVLPSYLVALGYVAADTAVKYYRASQRYEEAQAAKAPVLPPTAKMAAADTLAWQLFASVIIPGFMINRVVYFAGSAVESAQGLPSWIPLGSVMRLKPVRALLPTIVGLCTIPLIVEPIDNCESRSSSNTPLSLTLRLAVVHRKMDQTFRKWYNLPKYFYWGSNFPGQ
jgi:mitochondrial fission process protein 1